MMVLVLNKINTEETPLVLSLDSDDWSFDVNFNNNIIYENKNSLSLFSKDRNMMNSADIINFFYTLKNTDKTEISSVRLLVDDVIVFDSGSLNVNYNDIALRYQYFPNTLVTDNNMLIGPQTGLRLFIHFESSSNIILEEE